MFKSEKDEISQNSKEAVSKKDYDNENIMVVDGNWQPIISMELWDKVQKMLDDQKKAYPKYAKREQPVQYMLKGLVRCDTCDGPMSLASAVSGKSKVRTMQCSNYTRGRCHTSHSITMPRIESAFKEGLRKALKEKKFTINPKSPKKAKAESVDYDKLIAVEERRLARAKEAYLAEIDSIEQYAKNKKDITERIAELQSKKNRDTTQVIDVDAFAKKVAEVVKFIERDDVTEEAKNEALRHIIEKIVFEKAKGNLAIYFHDI